MATVKQARAMVINDKITRRRITRIPSLVLECGWRRLGSHASFHIAIEVRIRRKSNVLMGLRSIATRCSRCEGGQPTEEIPAGPS